MVFETETFHDRKKLARARWNWHPEDGQREVITNQEIPEALWNAKAKLVGIAEQIFEFLKIGVTVDSDEVREKLKEFNATVESSEKVCIHALAWKEVVEEEASKAK